MNKFKLSILLTCLIFTGCISKPHKPIAPIVINPNGEAEVKIKFHEKDEVKIGSSVDALSKSCHESLTAKGMTRNVCKYQLLGLGKIIELQPEKIGTVVFDESISISDKNEFEVSKE